MKKIYYFLSRKITGKYHWNDPTGVPMMLDLTDWCIYKGGEEL